MAVAWPAAGPAACRGGSADAWAGDGASGGAIGGGVIAMASRSDLLSGAAAAVAAAMPADVAIPVTKELSGLDSTASCRLDPTPKKEDNAAVLDIRRGRGFGVNTKCSHASLDRHMDFR